MRGDGHGGGVLVGRVIWMCGWSNSNATTRLAPTGALERKLATMSAQWRKTLAYDQGGEMADHARPTERLSIEVYLCDPHSPWQRAGCENLNGMLRQYLPKGMDMRDATQAQLGWIAGEPNNRPRKILEWARPNELWRAMLCGKSFLEAVALGT